EWPTILELRKLVTIAARMVMFVAQLLVKSQPGGPTPDQTDTPPSVTLAAHDPLNGPIEGWATPGGGVPALTTPASAMTRATSRDPRTTIASNIYRPPSTTIRDLPPCWWPGRSARHRAGSGPTRF